MKQDNDRLSKTVGALTIRGAAEVANVDQRQIRLWITQGRLSSFKDGRSKHVLQTDLEKLVASEGQEGINDSSLTRRL